jgi:tetratricopeptide (TPR) repeat protein
VRYDADNLGARLNLGDSYRLLGKYAEAKREFDWVLAREASMPQVHYDLALLYLYAPSVPGMTAKQQIAAAIAELNKYKEVKPRDVKDDSDELLQAAKVKEGEINAASAPAAPPPTPSATPSAAPTAAPSAAPTAAPAAPPPATPPPAAPPPAAPPPDAPPAN